MGQLAPSHRARGFTLIEVMAALTIIAVGAMAIAQLQIRGSRAVAFSRSMGIALEIADRWSARFKQDARTWTEVAVHSSTPTPGTVLGGTQWLKAIAAAPGVYQTIPAVTADLSNAFDHFGNDVDNTATTRTRYCASYRPSWVYYGRSMRIDIRVWWQRELPSGQGGTLILDDFPACADDNADLNPGGDLVDKYHVVYVPVIINKS